MKKGIILMFCILSIPILAQIKAKTEDGKDVVLFPDGTYRYKDETEQRNLKNINENTNLYQRDVYYKDYLESKRLKARLYYNKNLWLAEPFNQGTVEYRIKDNSGDIYAMFGTENITVKNLQMVKDIAVKVASRNADIFRLKNAEYRTVNGKKLVCLHYMANIQGLDFEYLGYYSLMNDGVASVICYSVPEKFADLSKKMENFMNGLVEE